MKPDNSSPNPFSIPVSRCMPTVCTVPVPAVGHAEVNCATSLFVSEVFLCLGHLQQQTNRLQLDHSFTFWCLLVFPSLLSLPSTLLATFPSSTAPLPDCFKMKLVCLSVPWSQHKPDFLFLLSVCVCLCYRACHNTHTSKREDVTYLKVMDYTVHSLFEFIWAQLLSLKPHAHLIQLLRTS